MSTIPKIGPNEITTAVYGDLSCFNFEEGVLNREFVPVWELNASMVGKRVWVRGHVMSKRSRFLIIREREDTVQAVTDINFVNGDEAAVAFMQAVTVESVVDLECEIAAASVRTTSIKDVELQIHRCLVVSRARPCPFTMADASAPVDRRFDAEMGGANPIVAIERQIEEGTANKTLKPAELKALQKELKAMKAAAAKAASSIGFNVRLDHRYFDLRTPANQAIFRIQAVTCSLFREFLEKRDFIEIHSPKLISGASEGGADVFSVDYFKRKAFLAQSPQLYKQMSITAGFERVFEVGPVFRSENSFTNRHMTEFVGLDLEMIIKNHYHEVLHTLKELFVFIFDGLSERCAKDIAVVHDQFAFEPFKWLPADQTPVLTFTEACAMLAEAGVTQRVDHDMSSEAETMLGQLVKEKYNTDFFILDQFPMDARPFYTMPHATVPGASNSYDLFMRGREITSGAQRIHDLDLLCECATKKGVPPESLGAYVDAFRYGAPPHGGAGIGLERVVSLFLDIGSVKRASLFPRDPNRLTP